MTNLAAAAEMDDRVARLVAAAEAALAAARGSGSLDAADPSLENLQAALTPLSTSARRVFHPKRQHTYVVGGTIELQISCGPYKGAEGKLVQVYHAPSGKAWGRFVEEFEDGRFVAVTTAVTTHEQ
jgi:quercetin dioxygenase-like cupin family protein